jgi:hypothetical protein
MDAYKNIYKTRSKKWLLMAHWQKYCFMLLSDKRGSQLDKALWMLQIAKAMLLVS